MGVTIRRGEGMLAVSLSEEGEWERGEVGGIEMALGEVEVRL